MRPDARRIGRPTGEPFEDRIDERLAQGTPEPLRSQLIELLGEDKVAARISDLVRYASDASPYRYLPQAVVPLNDLDDVQRILQFSRESGIPLAFRAAGTSLNGQSQCNGILVDVRRH